MELWVDIKRFKDYQVSNRGRIKSKSRFTVDECGIRKGRRRFWPEKILKPGVSKSLGYQIIVLRKNKKSYTKYVHLLVAEAFLPPKPDGCEINHKDGNKANPHHKNLEWKTHAYNMKHSISTGLRKTFKNQYMEVGKSNDRAL